MRVAARLVPTLWIALLPACSSDSEPTGAAPTPAPERPAHVVHEQRERASPIADTPWMAETVTLFRTTLALADLDVRCLLADGGGAFAGTASGLFHIAGGAAAGDLVLAGGPVVDLARSADGGVLSARPDGLDVLDAEGGLVAALAAPGGSITSVAAVGESLFVGTGEGLFRIDPTGLLPTAITAAVRDLARVDTTLWVATGAGVARYDAANDAVLPALGAPALLVDDDVRALAVVTGGGEVLAASAGGYARVAADGASAALVTPGLESLPNADLWAITESEGEVLSGHGIGATAMSAAHKDHYHTNRWIPAEQITAVALGEGGTRWIGTPAGVARITLAPMTLAEKTALLEPLVERHVRMDGFIDDGVGLADPWDPSSPFTWDNDNDGLWTQAQLAAFALAFAVTGDESYRERARRSLDVMFLLEAVPAATFEAAGRAPGFIARSLVRGDEGAVFVDKASQSNWHLQELDGRTYSWKDDTSSDEYVGHFFGLPLYYDLCASDDERARLREHARRAMDVIIDGGYLLLDLDGEPTAHGRWKDLAVAADGDLGACLAAGKQGCAASYGGGGWLNSIEILGHLLATWHMTGDDRYYDEYERLVTVERYGEMIPMTDHTLTVTSRRTANHSDHELASLAYFTLLRYEPNDDRREVWKQSILDFFEHERLERNPLEIAVIASAMGDDRAALADAVRTLQELPIDGREWPYDNGHRLDAVVDDALDRFEKAQFTTVLPYDEIRTMKWNGNPYVVAGGGAGTEVQGPWPYLLPYWMLRYSGAVVEP